MAFTVTRLSANIRGRDIVIGDLHGCYDVLMRLLDKIRFDPACDRVLGTGDLADRGKQSMACIGLVDEPWFGSARGNHDQNLIELGREIAVMVEQGIPLSTIANVVFAVTARNGGTWLADWITSAHFSLDRLNGMVGKLERLPHVLVVGDGAHRFNVVHADLISAGLLSDAQVDSVHGNASDRLARSVMESRDLYGRMATCEFMQEAPEGLSTTYCGHQIVPCLTRYAGHVFLDTGCCMANKPWSGLTGFIIQDQQPVFEATPLSPHCGSMAATQDRAAA